MRGLLIAGALAAFATAMPAWAQDSNQDDPGIVVEGQRDQRKKINAFVGAMVSGRMRDQVAQFRDDACPAAMGLTDALDAAITKRLRQVAFTAKVPLGKPDCRPNVIVIFAPDKREMVLGLHREHYQLFGERGSMEVRQIAATPGPAVAWHVTGRLNADGTQMTRDDEGVTWSSTAGIGASRLRSPTMPVHAGAVLVIEQKAVEGLSVNQVADYAAMRLFGNADPKRLPPDADTILSVFEDAKDADRPIALSLTQWDLGFLKGLYASDSALYAPGTRSNIASTIERDLKAGAKDGEDAPEKN